MTDADWQGYVDALGSLTRLEGEHQRRYAAADDEHTRAAHAFAADHGAIERQWNRLAEQAARSKAAGNELMLRHRLSAAKQPAVSRDGAGAALADAERTIAWCNQAARWVSAFEQRALAFAATPVVPAPPAAAPAVPVTQPTPEPRGKSACGPTAAAMLLAFVGTAVVVVLKVAGVI